MHIVDSSFALISSTMVAKSPQRHSQKLARNRKLIREWTAMKTTLKRNAKGVKITYPRILPIQKTHYGDNSKAKDFSS